MPSVDPQLQTIKQQLEAVLEHRIGDLLGHVKATQAVTRQIVAAEAEIHRQQELESRLREELGPLETASETLTSDNADLQSKVEKVRENVDRMRALKQQLMSDLSSLKNELHE